MALFNRYGYQLFPQGNKIIHERWMTCSNVSNSNSEERSYTFDNGDDLLGKNDLSNGFEEHANIVATKQND